MSLMVHVPMTSHVLSDGMRFKVKLANILVDLHVGTFE